MSGARHLYLHLPFCAHRCGYCDFVTAVGRHDQHGGYVDALISELELERNVLADDLETGLETVFLGGGTPTFTEPAALERLLAALPTAAEVTVEANPETVTPELAALLLDGGVNRISLGAQSFQPELLAVLDRAAGPDAVRAAFHTLRAAGFDNLSLDLIYGIPGQTPADLDGDLEAALALGPEHISAYELEAKPGTRFTHDHGEELERQAEAMEGYFDAVIGRLTTAGYRWYETANFCQIEARDLRSHHNLGYWLGHDYLGLGVGAVSTVGGRRWRNAPSLRGYVEALERGERPPREFEHLSAQVKAEERVMLGLRLDEPLSLAGLQDVVNPDEVARLEAAGLASCADGELALTSRGRPLGDAVTVELLRA